MKKIVYQILGQEVFTEIVFGTLIYTIVFGFLNDYTNLVADKSYSTIVLASLLMQLLVYPTLKLKEWLVNWFRQKNTKARKLGLIFTIWGILFVSKFVFLEILLFVFKDSLFISGFVAVLLIILCSTIITQLFKYIYILLGNNK